MSDSPPKPLLAPDAPTAPALRALLTKLVPRELPDDVDERLEARIQDTLEAQAQHSPRAAGPTRAAG